MTQILYFCKECGLRLSAEDTQLALKLGEDVQTSCCSGCRKAPTPEPAPTNASTASSAPTTSAAGARRSHPEARRAAARPANTTKAFPIVPFVSGMAAVGVVLAVFASSSVLKPKAAPAAVMEERKTPEPIESKRAEASRLEESPTTATIATAAPISRNDARLETARTAPAPAPALANSAQSDDLESSAALIDSLLRQRSFSQAMKRVEAFEQNASLAQAWNEKSKAWRAQAQSGSLALLNEWIRAAEQRAEAGDARGVQAVLGPRALLDLLDEHAQVAAQKSAALAARGEERAKAAQAQRNEQAAQLRLNFEATLPTEAELGAPLGGKILFGPGMKDAQFESGRDSVRSVNGRTAYIDGTQKVVLGHATNLGMLQAGNDVCVEYTAVQDTQVYIKVSGEKDVGGTVTLPAGKLQRKTIAIDNKRASSDGLMLNFKGHWAGRSFKRVHLEFKNCPPGSIAVFRVSVK